MGGGITLLSIIAYVVPHVTDHRLPWALDCALMASFFYGLGRSVKKIKIMDCFVVLNKHIFASLAAMIIVSAVLIPLVFLNGSVNMRTVTYGNYFLYIFNALAYSFLLIAISMLIEFMTEGKMFSNVLEWIGRNTLIVLMLNSTCVRAYEVVAGGILAKLGDTAVYGINAVVAVIITIACVVASNFINRYCPWLLGKSEKI